MFFFFRCDGINAFLLKSYPIFDMEAFYLRKIGAFKYNLKNKDEPNESTHSAPHSTMRHLLTCFDWCKYLLVTEHKHLNIKLWQFCQTVEYNCFTSHHHIDREESMKIEAYTCRGLKYCSVTSWLQNCEHLDNQVVTKDNWLDLLMFRDFSY